ncbi:MAG: RecQ family ATP-dependent DNA helicase [Planctomycetaceae bacterium]|nr:RecQ family ATP-dependent DNA helicase [Planctomycetaceae bacterium]
MVDKTDPTNLLATFGLSEFRPGQREVVDAVAAGEDVMCVMPTGGGKSLCYQLPSLSKKGTTIVVSPLIALMKDQVDGLKKLGIRASLINSSLSGAEQTEVLNEMASGNLNLVYVAPERLRNSRFLDAISNVNINLLAIDEAHCVSEWGHDFRPDYSRLGRFRERYLKDVQTIALTATATPMVRDDISAILRLKTPQVFVTGFARTNLRFSVTHAKSDREKDEELTRYISSQTGTGIIYAATRKRCEELAQWLPEKTRRPIGAYHAGLEPAQRQRVQDDFMSGKLSAIVATNAFGMGIDKSDIRFVVHYNIPGSLEAYYQEAGRAGRDGKNSECRLLFSYSDRYIQEFFIENRYPQRETVKSVYDFLLTREEDPIELTQEQIREEIGVKEGTEAIGTAQTLLAKSGVLRRLDSASNHAIVRIESDEATLLDFLPKEAKLRRKVMVAIERMVGRQRREDVYVRLPRLADMAGVDSDQLKRTLRELNRLRSFDYIPPFRGRAVHLVQRDLTFEQLEIDFEDLNTRKRAEFEKLEAVIKFARTAGCRQRVILQYFGEAGAANCGLCDRCHPNDGSPGRSSDICLASDIEGIDSSSLLRGIQVVLSGVTRMHGRFGKNMVAQMLCGSRNKKLQQWKLHQLSTYGLLSGLRQTEVVNIMDALIETGLLQQKEVDERRPTLHMTEDGRRVMRSETPLPAGLQLPLPLAKRLAKATGKIEAADVQTDSRQSAAGDPEGNDGELENPQTLEMAEKLKRWRRKNSAALGIPAYRVLTNATIDRIAESCPTSREDLESISGVGPATMEQFGDDIITLVGSILSNSAQAVQKIDTVAAESEIPEIGEETTNHANPGAIPASPTTAINNSEPETSMFRSNSDSKTPPELPTRNNERVGEAAGYWTWRLFSDGYSESEVMAIRHCDSAELVSQLLLAIESGLAVDPGWITNEHGTERLRNSKNGPAGGG